MNRSPDTPVHRTDRINGSSPSPRVSTGNRANMPRSIRSKPFALSAIATPILALTLASCGSSGPTFDPTVLSTEAPQGQASNTQSTSPSKPNPSESKSDGASPNAHSGDNKNSDSDPQTTDSAGSSNDSPEGTGTQTVTGTLRKTDYAGVLKIQGIEDPIPGTSERSGGQIYYILVLESPTEIVAKIPGATDRSKASKAKVIGVSTPKIFRDLETPDPTLDQYDGKHISMIVENNECWWPSDPRLPLGEPSCFGVQVK